MTGASQDTENPSNGLRLVADTAASSIDFSVRFMGLSRVTGTFHQFAGTVLLNESDFEESAVEFSVSVGSIDTENHFRDDDLSQNWFEMAPYPESVFRSDSIRANGNGWIVHGPLTIKNVTRQIAIPVTVTQRRGAGRLHTLEVSGDFTIDRMVYGVDDDPTSNSFFDASKMIVGDNVKVILLLLLRVTEEHL